MIIKYTFNDNDFTQVIEKYLEEFGPFYAFNYNMYNGLDEFKKLLSQYDDYMDKYSEDKELTKEEFNKLKNKLLIILKDNFTNYINNIRINSNWHTDGLDAIDLQNSKNYILKNIKIKIVKSIPDQWENGEVVYYITSNQKYITM